MTPRFTWRIALTGLTICTMVSSRATCGDLKKAQQLYEEGKLQDSQGDVDGAIETFDKAINENPRYTYAYDFRGWLFYKKKAYDKAIADFSKAIEINQLYALAYIDRGDAKRKVGDNTGALSDLDRAIQLQPGTGDLGRSYQLRADVRSALGDKAGSEADRKAAGVSQSAQRPASSASPGMTPPGVLAPAQAAASATPSGTAPSQGASTQPPARQESFEYGNEGELRGLSTVALFTHGDVQIRSVISEYIQKKLPQLSITDRTGVGGVVYDIQGNGTGHALGSVYRITSGGRRVLATFRTGERSGSSIEWMGDDLAKAFVTAVEKANK